MVSLKVSGLGTYKAFKTIIGHVSTIFTTPVMTSEMSSRSSWSGLLTGEGDFVCGKDRIGLQGRFIISRPLTSVSDLGRE